jgi:hypothetical protein
METRKGKERDLPQRDAGTGLGGSETRTESSGGELVSLLGSEGSRRWRKRRKEKGFLGPPPCSDPFPNFITAALHQG